MNKNIVTQQELKDLFDYHDDGFFICKVNTLRRKAGEIIKTNPCDGYTSISVNGNRYLYHRLIFLWHHGYLPDLIDHINQIRSDNRIENLRHADKSLNAINSKKRSDNSSGVRGVHFFKRTNSFQVYFGRNKKRICVGYFKDKTEATEALKKALAEFDMRNWRGNDQN